MPQDGTAESPAGRQHPASSSGRWIDDGVVAPLWIVTVLPVSSARCGLVGKQGSVPRGGEQSADDWVEKTTLIVLPGGTVTNLGEIAKSNLLTLPGVRGVDLSYFPYGRTGTPAVSDQERAGSSSLMLPSTVPELTVVICPSPATLCTVASSSRSAADDAA